VARDTVPRSAEGAKATEDLAASVAAVKNLPARPEGGERIRHRSVSAPDAELLREPPKERTVAAAGSEASVHPGVRGLVQEGVEALGLGKVRGDRDPMGPAVPNLAAGQFPAREAYGGRGQAEARGEAVVEALQAGRVVGRLCGKEKDHAIRLAKNGGVMTRKTLFLVAALGLAAGAAGAAPAGKMVSYPSGSETVSGYLAVPEAAGKKPAIVVIQEWWGLNDFVRQKADHFAAEGYVALAPDLYAGQATSDPMKAHELSRIPPENVMRQLKAAVAYLKGRPDVDADRMASIGWCFGGGYSLELAFEQAPPLSGAVVYYGRLVADRGVIANLRVPLLGNFGGIDQGIPADSVRAFERDAKQQGKSVDFKVYPDAGHAFASSSDPKVYRPADAKDADARADAFLARVLKER
jgi:carboxymethylenebutenolidase